MSSPTTTPTPNPPGKKAKTIVNSNSSNVNNMETSKGSFSNLEGNDFIENGDQLAMNFRVVKTNNRVGRGRGTSVKFGRFAARGGVVGSQPKPKKVTQNADGTTRPTRGVGSRGGRGAYKKAPK